jgi:hypothetical protein
MLVSLSSITGCASQKLTTSEMLDYQTNCKKAPEQIAFLERVSPNRDDQFLAMLKIMAMGPFAPFSKNYDRDVEMAQRSGQYWSTRIKEEINKCE